jgi:branched-chain amino acid transport system permease protein
MGVINFAHGELYMFGAYAVVYVYAENQLPFFLAVAAGLVFVGLLGLLMERALFRPMRDNPLGGLIASIGFLLILQTAAVLGFGVRMEHIPPPTREVLEVFGIEGVVLSVQRLYVIVATVLLLGALWIFLRRSKFGVALRACAQDAEAAALQGISMNQAARIAMFIGAALAGIAGALTAPLVRTYPFMGHSVIVTAFIIIIVGGIGSLEGAVVAAVLYAMVHTFVTTFIDGVIADIVGLLLMLAVLVVRPTGLLGTRDRA